MITTIASQQSQLLRRQHVTLVGLATMLAVTAMAGILGWSSHHTIVRVFDEAVRLQAAAGQPAPANPFLLKPNLSLLSNMVVYIPLIGSLLALVVGHLALVEDQGQATGRLLFTRQVTRSQYVLGKILACTRFLAVTMAACALVSVAALVVVNRALSASDVGRLAGFYVLSWAYLTVFALVGMLTALLARRRSLALLSAMGVWLVITFVVPQFTSGLRPTQSLNPLTEPVGTSQAFFRATQRAQPLSIVEQYKTVSGTILGTAPNPTTGDTLLAIVPIVSAAILLTLLVLWKVQHHDYARSVTDE
ncbi:MAG: ABC transporter permease subunit [Propionibacteriales bacterium]|nr:ABC transporter permease subunit [Propionibacteriales bacterium]